VTSLVADAIAYWNALLQEGYLESTVAGIARAVEQRQLSFMNHSIARVLRPHFVEPEEHRRHIEATSLVSRGITAMAKRAVAEPALLAELGLTEHEAAIATMEPGGVTEIYSRLDGFVGGDGVVRFLEANSMGAGPVFESELESIFASLPIFQAFRERYAPEPVGGAEFLVGGLHTAFARRGGSGQPNIALVSRGQKDSLMMINEPVKMIGIARAAGCNLRVVQREQIECRDGSVVAGDFKIDVMFCDDWPGFFEAFALSHPFWTAVRERKLWLANSYAGRLVRGNKRLFALLSDPQYTDGLEPEVRDALARHVPWTRALRDGKVTFRGETVELMALLATRRQELVLKPALEFGGHGVVVGWDCDDATWQATLDEARRRPYVVQERATTYAERFPTIVDGQLRFESRFVDVNPFIWNEADAAGWLVRLSKAAIMNVSAGEGSLTATFALRAK
jgi:hypothetical protein